METKKNELLKNRLGEKHITKEGYEIEIIEYFNNKNCTIKFNNGVILRNKNYRRIKNGEINNPFHLSVYSIGYLGEGSYKSIIENKRTREYIFWHSMMERCYSKRCEESQPTYADCTVSEEWHNFQNFAKWYEENWKPEYMEGWHLDKDILQKGNKIYSPETCCFVPSEINIVLVKNNIRRGDLPIGASKHGNNFQARFNTKGKLVHLGTFNTPEQAFQAYKTAKESYIKELAEEYKHQITDQVYQALTNYNVEITD